ncbi:glycoside hydrolase family 3 C-terminal domain-containing protein [Flagellatimonas centrodinii]|uniref:beta-glucosidase family protein n=1 Tax=Flagellatimonas centrodinii TaxID=2806210 RepID=UPI001FEE4C34|nr:glycoside hydrolase family 3 C-terminal domain-containing protein [Flagellatimonas centrodinii]ULQ46069.1 glycoside hydrolase family 3 C-terminal domain-containing protein [Flagellatimonas centrodinii]
MRLYRGRGSGRVAVALVVAMVAGCGGDTPLTMGDAVSLGHCGDIETRPWCDTALTPAERSERLLAAMTLMQKIALLSGDDPLSVASGDPYVGISEGIPELGIPDLRMSDGPVGVRGSPTTAMPIPLALGATFNPALAWRTGATIANEVRHKGNDVLHGPVGDLVRNPLAGRTFETFGEDPWLATRMTVEWVRGAQSEGVLANAKHFLMNTQEGIVGVPPLLSLVGGRQTVNAVVDERTLHELYLLPFEAAVREADVASLMCAYNYVNGESACGSPALLQGVLRDQWQFDGFLISDYVLAVKDTVQSVNAGAVIEMPFPLFYQPLLLQSAVLTGLIGVDTLDARVGDILRTLFRFGFFDRARYVRNDDLIDQAAHAAVAREVVEQGAVLLRNDGVLPIDPAVRRIAVIGVSATERPSGGGSSSVTPFVFVAPLDAIRERAGPDVEVMYDPGDDPAAAAALAATAEVVLLFAADVATEGVDKLCLSLDCTLADVPDSLLLNTLQGGAPDLLDLLLDPVVTTSPVAPILDRLFGPIVLGAPVLPVSHRDQDGLIRAVVAANPATVLVLQTSGAVLTPWRDQVAALLAAWYSGQEAGAGLARVVFGDTDPGGRLPVSFPDRELDTPVAGQPSRYPGIANQARHDEGVFIGYRWFDANGVAPAFPFGFGLSYTDFALSDLELAVDGDAVAVAVTATNVGGRAGWAVPQVYVGAPTPAAPVPQPPLALKAFDKQWLAPGEAVRISMSLPSRAFAYWAVDAADWQVAPGCYPIRVGWSSRDLPLSSAISRGAGSCD